MGNKQFTTHWPHMDNTLHEHTVSPLLMTVLKTCMSSPVFDAFRLVGGTALSLQRGHRTSADIDLFTDATYGSVDLGTISAFLRNAFPYVDSIAVESLGPGKSFFVGHHASECIKMDVYYTDAFISNIYVVKGIRMAGVDDMIAMKTDVIMRGGRKKDFWDIHELINEYSLEEMLALHQKRYPFGHNASLIKQNFTDFSAADDDFDPVCLRGKYWELIKLDIIDFVSNGK